MIVPFRCQTNKQNYLQSGFNILFNMSNSEESLVLLILDGHLCHTRNIELIDMQERIKIYVSDEISSWFRSSSRPLIQYDIKYLNTHINAQ